jgi:hypothetical protein
MVHLPLKAGVALCAFVVLGFTGVNAAPRPAAGATDLLILAGDDEENAEVQNLLEPQTDQGTPMDAPGGGGGAMQAQPAPEGEMAPAPEGGGGDAETNEMQSEH